MHDVGRDRPPLMSNDVVRTVAQDGLLPRVAAISGRATPTNHAGLPTAPESYDFAPAMAAGWPPTLMVLALAFSALGKVRIRIPSR